MSEERTYTVALEPMAVRILYVQVGGATWNGRQEKKCLDKAYSVTCGILGVVSKLDGSTDLEKWKDVFEAGKVDYVIGSEAMVGFRIALTQAITGGQNRPPVTITNEKQLMSVVDLFPKKFVEAVRKAAGLDGDEDKKDDIEDFSDETEEKVEA